MASVTIAKPQILHAGDLFSAFKGFSSVTVNMPSQVWLSSCLSVVSPFGLVVRH